MSDNENDVIRHTCKCDKGCTEPVLYNLMRKYGCEAKTCPNCGSSMTCVSEVVSEYAAN